MQKKIAVIVLISIFCLLSAENSSREIFAESSIHNFLTNYSARNVAMGFISGTSNVWGEEVADQGNPALLGYLKGFSYRFSFSTNKYIRISDSSLSFGFKGLGFSLPTPSDNWKFGFVQHSTALSYEEEPFGPTGEEFEYFDLSQKFSFGLNLYETLTSFKVLTPKDRNMEFSFGVTMHRHSMKYEISNIYIHDLDFWTRDYCFNFMVDVNKIINKNSPIDIAFSTGYYTINPMKKKVRFNIDNDGDGQLNEDPFDLIDNDNDGLIDEDGEELKFTTNNDNRLGLSLHFSLPIDSYDNLTENKFLCRFSKSILNTTLTTNYGIDFQSTGFEITLFDIISYRMGFYDENTGSSAYDDSYRTSGLGLQLKDNIFALKGNLTMINGAPATLPEKLYEISINFNLIEIFGNRI